MKKSILTCLLVFPLLTFSQEIKKGDVYNYGREIVDSMASEHMHGRGYVFGGDSIAANYIREEYKKLGLKSFNNNYSVKTAGKYIKLLLHLCQEQCAQKD